MSDNSKRSIANGRYDNLPDHTNKCPDCDVTLKVIAECDDDDEDCTPCLICPICMYEEGGP